MTWQVIHGDCLEVMRTLPRVDACISDPPYGMDWDTVTKRFSGGSEASRARRGIGISAERDVLGDNEPFDPSPWLQFDRVTLWGSNHFGSRLPVGTTLVWIKRNDRAFGSFLSDAEVAWERGGHGIYCFRDFSMTAEAVNRKHPTQKPIPLMRWCIRRQDLPPNSTILDPFCGSGSTGVAALAEGMNFIGIEREAKYVEIARKRIAAEAAQGKLAF